MADPIAAEPPPAASPAADQAAREVEVLAGLIERSLELARGFQALGVTAEDLDAPRMPRSASTACSSASAGP